MRNIRIYQEGSFEINDILNLNESASHHLWNVLRQRAGNIFIMFNNNHEYQSEILGFNKKFITIKILSKTYISRETKYPLDLIIGIPKGDTMDNVVQKATELGISTITPIITEYCNIKLSKFDFDKKLLQWQKIAIGACEQCERNIIPDIKFPITFEKFIYNNKKKLIVMHPYTNKSLLNTLQQSYSNKSLLEGFCIGPEGGFSDSEILALDTNNIIMASLGKRILRVETAVIASLALIQAFQEELC